MSNTRIMFRFSLIIICLSLCWADNNNSTDFRKSKQFSLFSVVQFPNDVCTTTSGTFSNGTCVTSSECSSNSGSATGSCAAGFGVCCVYSVSASGSTISRNTSYIVNPSYPSGYTASSYPSTVSYTITKESCDICRLRLDYEAFQLTTPKTTAPIGQCDQDYMTVVTTGMTSTPVPGQHGHFPYFCGKNAGLHAYIDMSCTCSDEATISFVIGDATDNTWKIKVSQLSCNDDNVAAYQGCLQYFTGLTGTVSSYGVQSGLQIAGQDYSICIRPEVGHCCIEYTATTYDMGRVTTAVQTCFHPGAAGATLYSIAFLSQCAGTLCQYNSLLIPKVISPISGVFPVAAVTGFSFIRAEDGHDRFCGSILAPNGLTDSSTQVSTPVVSCERPFLLGHRTQSVLGFSPATNGQSHTGFLESTSDGFVLEYRQIAGNC